VPGYELFCVFRPVPQRGAGPVTRAGGGRRWLRRVVPRLRDQS
jgi:hypothetical protein